MKTHLDLFSGIGGFAIAAQRCGYTTIGFCEKEPYAQQVLKERFGAVLADAADDGRHRNDAPGNNAGQESAHSQQQRSGGYGRLAGCSGKPRIHGDIFTLNGADYAGVDLLTGGFPVSLSVSPGSEKARQMTARSGRKCSELLTRQDPLGSLVRMLLGSCQWNSTISFLTWKASATPRGRLLFRLVPSMPDTDGTEFGSSGTGYFIPTPDATNAPNQNANTNGPKSVAEVARTGWKPGMMWPTPRAGKTTDETEEAWTLRRDAGKVSTPPLTLAVKMWPTPTVDEASNVTRTSGVFQSLTRSVQESVKMWPTPTANEDACGKSTGKMQAMLGNHPQLGKTSETGSLNPAWVEWLMGYPIGHTACADWETPSSRRLLKKSSEQSPA